MSEHSEEEALDPQQLENEQSPEGNGPPGGGVREEQPLPTKQHRRKPKGTEGGDNRQSGSGHVLGRGAFTLRSGTVAGKAARDRIERAAGSLASRIAEARELLESDLSTGAAAQHVLHLSTMERGLHEIRDIFLGHYDNGLKVAGDAPPDMQDFLYNIITEPLPAATRMLGLQQHPTPAELLQIADEHIADVRMVRQPLETEQEALSVRSVTGSSIASQGSRPWGDRLPEQQPEPNEAKREPHPPGGQRVMTPVHQNVANLIRRQTPQLVDLIGGGFNNGAQEWVNRTNELRRERPPLVTGPVLGQFRRGEAPPPQQPTNHLQNRGEALPARQPPDQFGGRGNGLPAYRQPGWRADGTTTFETVRLQPPTFSGKPEDWTTFWAYFQRAVDDKPIPGFEKQLHLLRCLKEGSPARRAVEVYPPSDGNYPVVVHLLKERFGDTDDLQRAIRAQLLHLQPAKDNVNSLTTVIDEFERGVCQLEQLGANIDDESFGPLLEAKLPVRILTELRIRESTMGAKWTVREFRRAVASQVRCMRAAESALAAMREPERRPEQRMAPQRAERGVRAGREGFQRAFMVRDHPPGQQQRPEAQNRRTDGPPPTRRPEQFDNRNGSHSRQAPPQQRNGNEQRGPFAGECSLCGKTGHFPSRCPNFSSVQARRTRLIEQRRCLRCLASTHTAQQCQRGQPCRWCKRDDHHWIICWNGPRGEPLPAQRQPRTDQPNRTMMVRESAGRRGRYLPCATPHGQPGTRSPTVARPERESPALRDDEQRAFTTVGQRLPAYLMVCPVMVAAENGKSECQATLLLDPGSHVDCADAALIRQLNPEKTGSAPLEIQVFGGKKLKMPSGKYRLRLKRTDGGWESLEVSEVEKICTPIRTELISPGATPDRFQTTTVTTQPQLLIGIRKFWDFVQGFRKSEEGAYLIDTVFGTILCGEQFQATTGVPPDPTVFAIAPCGDDEREQMPAVKAVEQFWSLETIGIRDDPTNDADAEAVIQFERSVQQQNDGRYTIRLPWREEFPALPTNYSVAYRRLIGMLLRLQRTPEVLKQYQQIIDDQLQAGVIEETTIGTGQREYFIPHQAVITPKKLRIVYDASAHAKGVPSLNDCLLRGPVWLPDLAGMLIRFRACQVPVIADVEKAFLMVGIEEADREMCKFLWVRDPSAPITTQNLAPYRFRRLAFGLTPSPFCLAAVVRHHLRKYGSDFAEQLIRDTYVDNVLIPADSLDEAAAKAKEAKEMFAAAKMNLREFLSNNNVLNDSFSEADFLGKTTAKMLGLEWDAVSDNIQMKYPGVTPVGAGGNTRRAVLKTIASLFDPLGFLAPATLPAKQFFQKLWDSTHGWDTPLGTDDTKEWEDILASWEGAITSIPRGIRAGDSLPRQLHVFTDASEVAYAAVAYLRSEGPNGNAISRLVMAKSRLKPKKAATTFTIPRMELMGLLLGVRVAAFVKAQLHRPIAEEHIWSDSMIALHWIRNRTSQPQFIANRLAEIRRSTEATFHYVRTNDNPADMATRGIPPARLQHNQQWWNGPNWLSGPSAEWTRELEFKADPEDKEPLPEEEMISTAMVARGDAIPEQGSEGWPDSLLNRCGQWAKARRVTAWTLRFINTIRQRLQAVQPAEEGEGLPAQRRAFEILGGAVPPLQAEELHKAAQGLIQAVQRTATMPAGIRSETDHDGVQRLISRIGQCEESAISQPVILPKGSRLGTLIIDDIHERFHHAGVDGTLAEFLYGWWTPSARQQVRRVLGQCRRCRRLRGMPYPLPRMPPLPADRVQRRLPFESVGLDYLGPTVTRDDNGQRRKAWVLLITCLTTRAIYVDATRDLSAPSFISALRRFIARRGAPNRILSDNAPTFKLVGKSISDFGITGTDPIGFADSRGIRWRFTPQHTPWAGGIFERAVQLVKRALQKTLGGTVLSYDGLSTLLAEIEATVNSRPITYVNSAAGDPHPLRPIDFIQENNRLCVEPPVPTQPQWEERRDPPHVQLTKQWRDSRQRLDHFWRRWHREYLMALRERAGWTHTKRRVNAPGTPKIGDVVLVEDKFHPRNLWAMGRIEEVKGSDGQIRSVTIRMPNGRVWGRPVNKICPLEETPEANGNGEDRAPRAVPEEEEAVPEEWEKEGEENAPANGGDEAQGESQDEFLEVRAVREEAEHGTNYPVEVDDGGESETPRESEAEAAKVEIPVPEVRAVHQTEMRRSARNRKKREVWSPTRREARRGPPVRPGVGLGLLITLIGIMGAFGCQPAIRSAAVDQFLPAGPATEAPCDMRCSARGVTVSRNSDVDKLEICCPDGCWATTPRAAAIDYELPAEQLIHGYHCHGQCWKGRALPHNVTRKCPAKAECELISCTFCWELIGNPTCNPRWAAALFGFGMALMLAICGCVWPIIGKFCLGATIFWRAVAWAAQFPVKLYNRITGAQLPTPTTAQVEKGVRKGAKKARAELRELQQRLKIKRRAQAMARAWKHPEKGRVSSPGAAASLIALVLIIGTTMASKPLSVVVRSEDCARTPEGLKCAGTAATVLTLLPADQTNSFVIRTALDELLGAVRLRLASISMICVPRTEQWLRSYIIETAAVKRCPAAGSCNNDYCSSVRSGSKVPELVELNHRPGHSMCMRSSSFWQNSCALPTAACLFYRWAAVPTTTTVFEEFGCLEWDLQIGAGIELETNDGKLDTKELTLHPGVPEEWGNMTISVLPASLPPLPVLAEHFLTDGRAMAMVKSIPSDLHCTDEDQARGFDNCQLAIDSCRKCTPNHDNGSIHCHCRDLDLERVMAHPEQRLPLDVARLHLHHRGPEVRAEFQYTPVQLRIQLHGVELLSEYSNTRCWVTSPKLSGCYRCTAGAVFEAKCQTDHGIALAKVKCADGTLFALHCGDNGTTTTESIPFDRAEVFTECRVKCPAGATTFRLQGELAFLPKQQQFGFGQRESRGGRLEQGGGFSFGGFGIDPFPLLHLIMGGPWLPIALGAALLALVALYLFLKFNPHRQIFKLLLICALGAMADGGPSGDFSRPLQDLTKLYPEMNTAWSGQISTLIPLIAPIGTITPSCQRWQRHKKSIQQRTTTPAATTIKGAELALQIGLPRGRVSPAAGQHDGTTTNSTTAAGEMSPLPISIVFVLSATFGMLGRLWTVRRRKVWPKFPPPP